jgi:hypothetical protein
MSRAISIKAVAMMIKESKMRELDWDGPFAPASSMAAISSSVNGADFKS